MIDLNQWRDNQIQFGGLSVIEKPSTFYYDETNNVRKLKLNARGFNVREVNVFVLGGICHQGDPRALDLIGLRKAMRVQQNVKELKFHHVASGIQLSDIVVGLLAKMHTFLTRTSMEDVHKFRRNIGGTSLENIELLRNCLSRSDAENPAFLHHVASLTEREKIDCLLQFADGAFANDRI